MSGNLSNPGGIQRWFFQRRRIWIELSILSIVLLIMLEIYMFFAGFPPIIVRFAPMLVAPLLGIIVMGTFWRGSLALAVVLMGVACVSGGMFVMPYALSHGLTIGEKLVSYTTFTFTIGIGALAVSMIMVYKPSLLYAKNRPKGEQPPPVWSREMAGTKMLVPLRKLLSENERFLLSNYNYVMVSINGMTYLVPPGEAVPEGSSVLREGGFFVGIRKAYDGYFF